jgi:mannose-6-phosphate isomerase-like protein (cupin superfamily)
MTIIFDHLVTDDGWTVMGSGPDQQNNPSYYWYEGGTIADAPVDFKATFADNMFVTTKPIDVGGFNRNPLRCVPNFVVPRHYHNLDEMILVFQGQYSIDYGEGEDQGIQVVRPGQFFISRAGTPYTMTAGPEGVTYIETWPVSVSNLTTIWLDVGWVHR